MQIRINESDYSLTPLQEEASTRRYFLTKNEQGEDLVLCKDSNGVNSDFICLSTYLRSHDIPVPQVYSYDTESGFILQEFCGVNDLSTLDIDDYIESLEIALELLIAIQSLTPHTIVASRKFDYDKLSSEMIIMWESLTEFKAKYNWEIFDTEELKNFLLKSCEYLNMQKDLVFVHRDFHSRNILINPKSAHPKFGRLILIDFQDARMGTPQYDLSSILYDAYKPLPIDIRIEFLEKFKSKLSFPQVRFKENYYIQALQRSFKALGTYFIQVGIKNNMKFKSSLFHCLENIKEICQLGHFPDSAYIFADSLLRFKDRDIL